MSNSTQSAQKPDTSPRKTAAPTTENVRTKAHDVIDDAADRAEGVERRLRDEAAEARVKLSEKKEAATEQFEHTIARLEAFIRERPMTATAIAFGAGILATRLSRR